MVLLLLKITAELENLTDFQPAAGGEDFTHYIKVQCGSCREVSPRESMLTSGEVIGTAGRQRKSGNTKTGEANLVQKCSFCSRSGTISLIDGHGKPLTLDDSETGKFAPLILLDCRGMEAVEYIPKDGWVAQGAESGTKFDIDLSDGDYSEYDAKAGCSVGVFNFKFIFEKTKL